jgi:hypothetical protein
MFVVLFAKVVWRHGINIRNNNNNHNDELIRQQTIKWSTDDNNITTITINQIWNEQSDRQMVERRKIDQTINKQTICQSSNQCQQQRNNRDNQPESLTTKNLNDWLINKNDQTIKWSIYWLSDRLIDWTINNRPIVRLDYWTIKRSIERSNNNRNNQPTSRIIKQTIEQSIWLLEQSNAQTIDCPIVRLDYWTMTQWNDRLNDQTIDRKIKQSIEQSNNNHNNQPISRISKQKIERSSYWMINSIARTIECSNDRSSDRSIGLLNDETMKRSIERSNDRSNDQTTTVTITLHLELSNKRLNNQFDCSNNRMLKRSIIRSFDWTIERWNNETIDWTIKQSIERMIKGTINLLQMQKLHAILALQPWTIYQISTLQYYWLVVSYSIIIIIIIIVTIVE